MRQAEPISGSGTVSLTRAKLCKSAHIWKVLVFLAFLGMSGWAVIANLYVHRHGFFPPTYDFVSERSERPSQTENLPGEKCGRLVRSLLCWQFGIANERVPLAYVVCPWNRTEVLNLNRYTHSSRFLGRLDGSRYVSVSAIESNEDLIHADVWPIGQAKSLLADFISFPRGSQLLMDYARVHSQSDQCGKSDSNSPYRYGVKSPRSIYLVLAIVLLLGIFFYLVGMRLNLYGI